MLHETDSLAAYDRLHEWGSGVGETLTDATEAVALAADACTLDAGCIADLLAAQAPPFRCLLPLTHGTQTVRSTNSDITCPHSQAACVFFADNGFDRGSDSQPSSNECSAVQVTASHVQLCSLSPVAPDSEEKELGTRDASSSGGAGGSPRPSMGKRHASWATMEGISDAFAAQLSPFTCVLSPSLLHTSQTGFGCAICHCRERSL